MNLSLSNLTGLGSGDAWVPLPVVCDWEVGGEDLGAPKKDVSEASFFGFFRSAAERGSAFRLVDIGFEMMVDLRRGGTMWELGLGPGSTRQDNRSCERRARSIHEELGQEI